MRLIGKINTRRDALEFTHYLLKQGIESTFEAYDGKGPYNIWIYDEDQLIIAQKLLEDFIVDPNHYIDKERLKAPPEQQPTASETKRVHTTNLNTASPPRISFGRITLTILALCLIIFIWSEISTPQYGASPGVNALENLLSPPKKLLLYDFPKSLELLEELLQRYHPDDITEPQNLSTEGQALVYQYEHTPFWQGLYRLILTKSSNTPPQPLPQLFEKIREGEVWRLLTPIFLHADIFHILFNMMWLIILGNQMEFHLTPFKYLLFIGAVGIISNTTQYLMSGPIFLGFSGIITGMLAFIWVRQRIAPWEGYLLSRATIMFILFFVLLMFGLSLVSFLSQIAGYGSFTPGIANTAHIVGGIVGGILGNFKFFASKHS
ncbi:MAG: rhomboid family intramembrane serine protease [Chlamydiota bacterium]